jgi:hypothetical protein
MIVVCIEWLPTNSIASVVARFMGYRNRIMVIQLPGYTWRNRITEFYAHIKLKSCVHLRSVLSSKPDEGDFCSLETEQDKTTSPRSKFVVSKKRLQDQRP